MTEVDFVSDDDGGYDTEWLNSITFSHDIAGQARRLRRVLLRRRQRAGLRLAAARWTSASPTPSSDNVQFDFGCNFGVTKSAPDFQPFVGFSIRF